MPSEADNPFLRAVVAAPDDDLPRLIYADWLDDHGHPERAEFIRVQVELARPCGPCIKYQGTKEMMPAGSPEWCPKHDPLRRRDRELLAGDAWLRWKDLHDLSRAFGGADYGPSVCRIADSLAPGGERRVEWRFRRGFLSEITLTAADWLAHADALLAACPIRRVWRVTEEHPDGHWSGDGLVRLTTTPTMQEQVRLFSGLPRSASVMGGEIEKLLSLRWPGVRFELPAFRDDTPQPTATGRFSDGRPIYLDTRRTIRAMERVHELTREGD